MVPIARPPKILLLAGNYAKHVQERGGTVAERAETFPYVFLKPPSAVIAHDESIRLPAASLRVDYEGELGVVIGRQARAVPESSALTFVLGYTCVNDVTARDLQKRDVQFTRAKGFDTFCPAGPFITDEIDPDAGIQVQTRLNGELSQDGNTRDLIFPIAFLLRYITAAITLYPGDLIPTGTPSGVAPMQPGDTVEVTIEGIGALSNPVIVG